MKIQTPIFETAYINESYLKDEFLSILKNEIDAESFSVTDEVNIANMLMHFNENAKKNITMLDVIKFLDSSGTGSAKNLSSRIKNSDSYSLEYNSYIQKLKKDNRKWIVGFIIFIALAVTFVLYKFNYLDRFIQKPKEGAQVVVIDQEKLAISAIEPYLGKEISAEQSAKTAQQFQKNLQVIINSYIDNGYIIINKGSIYAMSSKNDITDDVLHKLGIKPVDSQDFQNGSNIEKYNVLKNFAQANVMDYENAANRDKEEQRNKELQNSYNNQQIITNQSGQAIDVE